MDALLTITVLFALAFALYGAFRPGADGPLWDVRWQGLDAGGRAKIAAAAQSRPSGAKPTDLTAPKELEERELVAGYRRRQRRRRAYLDLAASPLLIVVGALTLAGLMDPSTFGLIFSVYFLVASLWTYLRERQMDGRLRAVVDAEAPAPR